MIEDAKIMDNTKTDVTVSDDSDSGLQIDETSCISDDKVNDTTISPTEEVIPLNETNATQQQNGKSNNLENIIANEIYTQRKKRRKNGIIRFGRVKGASRTAKSINIVKAIERFQNFMDIQCRKCLFCPFVDRNNLGNDLIMHVQNSHEDKIDNWCSCCKEDIRSSSRHRKKCHMIPKCPFCRRKPVYFSIHVDFLNHINHLKTHCHRNYTFQSDFLLVEILLNKISLNLHALNMGEIFPNLEDSCDDEDDDDNAALFGPNSSQIAKKTVENKNTQTDYMQKSGVKEYSRQIYRKASKVTIVPPVAPVPPSLPFTDDDYVDSEDISLDKVPRMHVSVTGPTLKQFPWELVVDAVKRAEQLFYGNRLCLVCHELTNGAMDLGMHMLKNHLQITNGKWCHVCNQLVSGLFDHLQSHKRNVLKCSLCADSCESFSDLRSHLVDHAVYSLNRASRLMPRWFLCRKCPKAFPEEIEYNRHVTQH